MSLQEKLEQALRDFSGKTFTDPSREELIRHSVDQKEAFISANGALATWTPVDSTGRSPADTVMVKRPESEGDIDWDSPNNVPIDADTFDMLFDDALNAIGKKNRLYVLNRVGGADPTWAMPVRLISDRAMTSLFSETMIRPTPPDIEKSVFHKRPFTLIALPYDKLDPERYQGRLRYNPTTKTTSTMAVAMDLDRRMGIVYGSSYLGSVKKLVFTVMNYYLPGEGILPLHCSSNEGKNGDTAFMLGLSGTGKTTLSADPERALLGDDEHGWSDTGIANFENGCYAKLIHLDPEREPEIFNAVFHKDDYTQHGVIVENALMYPDGTFDLDDDRLTPNSRAAYPLTYLSNIKDVPVGGHPNTIVFLTADANAVLPPVAKLNRNQAMLWFLMGYTSKLAGTETGITEPKTVFSRFFGEPFMPRNPNVYAEMLGEKMETYNTDVYLVNTGWSGGPYGIGNRMDIKLTRAIIKAVLSGELKDVEYDVDPLFHLQIPRTCPGVDDPSVLHPKSTWENPKAYDVRARKLAAEFSDHFDKAYGNKGISGDVTAQCPGK